MTRLQVRVLGDIAVSGSGARPIAGPTQRRVLALLTARRNEITSIDQLVDACWPDSDVPDRAEHNIRTYVHRLRGALGDHGDRIETSTGGYRLQLADDETDLEQFEQLAGEAARLAETGELAAAFDRFDEAAALWRGRPYAELADEPWAEAESARVDEARVAMLEGRAEALLETGRASDAVVVLDDLVREEPYRERPRSLLMRALYESGRQAEALRAFQEYRQFLIDDAGVEPSNRLVELDREIAANRLGPVADRPRTVGNYELHERIGEGAFAVVHRATQSSLGREVAVKIVRAELADRPEFVRRFEAEAQMVSSIEHPSVVPLYDYWREPGHAYLVMRWMTGGSLETRLDDGGLDLATVTDLVDQIAAALDASHAHDVVHRDVKPANILFDDAGRAYLGDFGIALAAEERSTPQAALSEGSPTFASPEQLRREPAGPEADVHALGIVAFTALTGWTPFHDAADEAELLRRQLSEPVPMLSTVRAGLPTGLDDVIATATAKRPIDRYPTAGTFAAAFRGAAGGRVGAPTGASTRRSNPYLGLRPFGEADASSFHGRTRLVDELIDGCGDPDRRLLAVVGPSGSGKSSVVRAGLLPALRRGGVDGSANWFITTMMPGAHPYEALETALLRVATNPPVALLDQLRDGDRGVHRGVSRIVPSGTDTVLVVIDQFEELFTSTDEVERRRFLRALATAVTEPGGSLYVVITMRADFYDHPLRHPEFAPLFKSSTVAVTPLAPDEVEEAIVAPAAAVGVDFEAGLIAEIIADVHSQPGALPLLQYALTQTFDAADGETLTIAAYREVGGLTGALARHAETLYGESDGGEQRAIRRLLNRLVTLGEGTEDTRRRVRRPELTVDPATDRIIERFGRANLLTFDRDPASREPTVEIAHEALIREWPRLRGWLDEDRDGIRIHRHLTDTATAWIASGREHGELYRGGRLDAATTWATDRNGDLNDAEHEFLEASIRERDAEANAERARFDEQLRANRRLRTLVAVVTAVAVLAAAAGMFALRQRARADDEAEEALAQAAAADQARAAAEVARQQADASAADATERTVEAEDARLAERDAAQQADFERLLALARTTETGDPTVGLLLAVESERFWSDREDPISAGQSKIDRISALHRALTARPGFEGWLVSEPVGDITALEDGERIVTYTTDTVDVWNVTTRAKTSWPYPDPRGEDVEPLYRSGVAARDGTIFAASHSNGISIMDLATGEVLERIDRPSSSIALAISPDGTRVAAGFDDGVVQVWELGTELRLLGEVPRAATVDELAWSPDGRALAIGTYDGAVALWTPGTDAPEWEFGGGAQPGVDNGAWGLLFSGDGSRLVVSTQTTVGVESGRPSGVRALIVIDARTGAEVAGVTDPSTRTSLAWIDESERLVAGVPSGVGDVTIFDVSNADGGNVDEIGAIGGLKTGFSFGLAVLPRLGLAVTGGSAGLELRDLEGSGPLSVTAPFSPEQRAIDNPRLLLLDAFSDDGRTLSTSVLSASDLVAPALVDLDDPTGTPVAVRSPDDRPDPIWIERTGDVTFWGSPEGVVIRQGFDGRPLGPTIPFGPAYSVAVSPDGSRMLWVEPHDDGLVPVLYDVASGEAIRELDPGITFTPPYLAGRFSDDGTNLTLWSGHESASFDGRTGDRYWASAELGSVWFGRDTSMMTTTKGLSSPAIEIRRSEPPFEIVGNSLIGHQAGTSWHEPHPIVPWLATVGREGVVRVWDLDTRTQIGRPLPMDHAGAISWSPDGTKLVVPTQRGFEVWNFDADTWADIACRVAGRNLTRAEWDEFGPRTIDYRATCDQFPLED